MSEGTISLLRNGDTAYPRMLAAIRAATHTVFLSSYQMDRDAAGETFLTELRDAQRRGVRVRVLLDFLGNLITGRSLVGDIRRAGIPVAVFGSPTVLHRITNRYHRKLLVIDGAIAFFGGLNIRECHILSQSPRKPSADLHFELGGALARKIQDIFIDDWLKQTGEQLSCSRAASEKSDLIQGLEIQGTVLVSDPRRQQNLVEETYRRRLKGANHSVQIVTPYFLPGPLLREFINCVDRGVEVTVVVPSKTNPLVDAIISRDLAVLQSMAVSVYQTPPPFDHSKLTLIDKRTALVGSANWDMRSLRSNLEILLESSSPAFVAPLCSMVEDKTAGIKPGVSSRSLGLSGKVLGFIAAQLYGYL